MGGDDANSEHEGLSETIGEVMALMTAAQVITCTDYYGAMYAKLLPIFGTVTDVAAPVVGTIQKWASLAQTQITTNVDDYEIETDMLDAVHTCLTKSNIESIAYFAINPVQSLVNHCSSRGTDVDSSISDLATFLSYYNGGSGGSAYANMLTPEFAKLYLALMGSSLPADGVMNDAIHPVWNTAGSANGMGKRAVGGSFTDGDAVNVTLYSEVQPIVEVITDFSGGTAHPIITIAGTDDTNATTTTWTVTLDADNPVAAISTTITPAVTAQSRQTVAVASLDGIIAGSVLVVNSGLVDQEKIVVESVDGGGVTITAAFQVAHGAGAALTGNRSYATTPSTGSRRCADVSGITIDLNGGGHAAGQVRVVGRRIRVGV